MREIRFRGKRPNNTGWECGYLALHDFIANGQTHVEVLPETVGQSTGMVDVNGQKIYEGDVILFDTTETGGGRFYGEVIFNTDATLPYCGWSLWCVNPSHGWAHFDFCGRIEILGNIHDEPDLLEKVICLN